MSVLLAAFDPTAATSGTFNTLFANKTGKIVVYNHSFVNLQLSWAGNQEYAPAQTASLFCIANPTTSITWSQVTTQNLKNAPNSIVQIVSYGPNEPILGTFPAPLTNGLVLGNSVESQSGLQVESFFNAGGSGGATVSIGGVAGVTPFLKKFVLTSAPNGANVKGQLAITHLSKAVVVGITPGELDYEVAQGTFYSPLKDTFPSPIPSDSVGGTISLVLPSLPADVILNVWFYLQ